MKNSQIVIVIIILTTLLLFEVGCSSRIEKPIVDNDSTIIFPAKNANDISANIKFYRKKNKKNNELIGEGHVFTIMENENVRALIDIKNREFYGNNKLMFHIVWIDPIEKSIFQKQIMLSPQDSSSTIKSSISISPEMRQAGEYTLRLYFFRELIAEKNFELLPEFDVNSFNENDEGIKTFFCRKISKKTGKIIGEDTVFTLKEKRNIRAVANIENCFELGNRELLFRFDWIDSIGHTFFKKHIDVLPKDSLSIISSSISISPEKRQAGNYTMQLFLFDKLIAENNFELKEELKIIPLKEKNIKAGITLGNKFNKNTGELYGKSSIFKINKNERVFAIIDIENNSKNNKKKLKYEIVWLNENGKSFYKKQFEFASNISKTSLKSSISISSDKRKSGNFSIQIYFFNELIGEKKFTLL